MSSKGYVYCHCVSLWYNAYHTVLVCVYWCKPQCWEISAEECMMSCCETETLKSRFLFCFSLVFYFLYFFDKHFSFVSSFPFCADGTNILSVFVLFCRIAFSTSWSLHEFERSTTSMAQSQSHAHHRVSNPRREHCRRSRHQARTLHQPRRLPAYHSPTYDGGKDSQASWRIARKKPGVVYHLHRYFGQILPTRTWAVQCTTKASEYSLGPAPGTTYSQPKVDDHHARTYALAWLKRQATHAHVFVGPRHCRSRWSRQVDDRAIVHHCDGANETRRSLRTTSNSWNHSFPEPFPPDEPKPATNWPCTRNR